MCGLVVDLGEELVEWMCVGVCSWMVVDVLFGVFLLGGVDSLVVVVLMVEVLFKVVWICMIGFDEVGYDECVYVDMVVWWFVIDYCEWVVKVDDVGLIDMLVVSFDELFVDVFVLVMY